MFANAYKNYQAHRQKFTRLCNILIVLCCLYVCICKFLCISKLSVLWCPVASFPITIWNGLSNKSSVICLPHSLCSGMTTSTDAVFLSKKNWQMYHHKQDYQCSSISKKKQIKKHLNFSRIIKLTLQVKNM